MLVTGLAALAIAGLVVWMLLAGGRAQSSAPGVQIIPPADSTAVAGAGRATAEPTPVAEPTATAPPSDVTVYITGAVVNPGVYQAPAGHRLAHIVALAGGPTDEADLERINLAVHLADAHHYRIPAFGEELATTEALAPSTAVPPTAPTAPATPEAACSEPININIATADCLESLPGIGSVRAQSIVSHREQFGPFPSTQGITDVSGIGDGIYGRIAALITVGGG